jgi:hypothetical protein
MVPHHKRYKTGELPKIGDFLYNPVHRVHGICVSLYGKKGWARILWAGRPRAIVRPIYNIKLIKRCSNAQE